MRKSYIKTKQSRESDHSKFRPIGM